MEPVWQVDGDLDPLLRPVGLAHGRRSEHRRPPLPIHAEVRSLARQPAHRLAFDVVERAADLRRDRGRDGALDHRRTRQPHLRPALLVEEVQRHLGGEHRAPEIHEHEHAVVGPRPLDRGEHQHRVGADRVPGLVEPAGGLDPDVLPGHLACEVRSALGDAAAVRDDDDPDHVRSLQALDASVPRRK